jgi:hypothetical protein
VASARKRSDGECLERMEGKCGRKNHPGQTRSKTAQAKGERLIAEELSAPKTARNRTWRLVRRVIASSWRWPLVCGSRRPSRSTGGKASALGQAKGRARPISINHAPSLNR